MSFSWRNDPAARLSDIANAFHCIQEFVFGIEKEAFLQDTMRKYAVVRALEEACEAALWFDKHENGVQIRESHPEVDFRGFGDAGNIYRHQYGSIDYAKVWDDMFYGNDVAVMEALLVQEVPFYTGTLSRRFEAIGDGVIFPPADSY